jgi:hypothetical protein
VLLWLGVRHSDIAYRFAGAPCLAGRLVTRGGDVPKPADAAREHFSLPETYRIKGKLLLTRSVNDTDAAEATFGEALSVARAQQAKSLELRAATSMARLWRDQGKVQQAR